MALMAPRLAKGQSNPDRCRFEQRALYPGPDLPEQLVYIKLYFFRKEVAFLEGQLLSSQS